MAKFKPLLDAYGGPYKDKYRFWTGVTLMVRLIVTVTVSFTSGGLVVVNAYIIREHGSVSLCRDGQKTKWRLQCKY